MRSGPYTIERQVGKVWQSVHLEEVERHHRSLAKRRLKRLREWGAAAGGGFVYRLLEAGIPAKC